jgi:glycine cleavage system H protein
MNPTNLKYTKEHEWVAVDGDTGTIGVTDYAQGELGDIVYVELPEEGQEVAAGEVVGTIESVKAVSELYSPVSGTITEINPALEDQPETVNQDAFGQGWLFKVTLSNSSELDGLMDAGAYEELIG